MRHPRRVRLDFVAPVHSAPVAGVLLAIAGLAAAVTVGIAFNAELSERARLDGELARVARPQKRAPSEAANKSAEEAAAIERELAVPWSALLAELEAASRDSASKVSVLGVEPDPAKHTVRITAETRNLAAALDYLERLQQSKLLRYPMLESHERRKDDPEHPIRVKLAAEWRT
ncbi:MAG: hypothetical protein JSR73_15380 [Proteobacteria bacterium]|nr:hypothetical protein [Pseudomonadota bacterium]